MKKLNDLNDRTVYCNVGWDKETNKKTTNFGKFWGKMKRNEANTIAFKTGEGLVVVDVDTKNLDEIDKVIGSELKKLTPTVTTKRGYHYYFNFKRSNEFVNKAAYGEFVDVRSDGGLIFAKYIGKNPNISYKETGKIYKKIPKKLEKRLRELMEIKSKVAAKRDRWSRIEKGGIHDGTLSYIGKDFASGLNYDEVVENGVDYVERYLGGTPREMKMMMARIKDGYKYHLSNKMEKSNEVLTSTPEDIGGEFEDTEVRDMLVKAERGGALELERVMKQIKKKLKISMATQKDMLSEARKGGGDGLNAFFDGDIVFDYVTGEYCEVRERNIIHYPKASFTQVVMSSSGYMKPSEVSEVLYSVPKKRLIYAPDIIGREINDENGDEAINSYVGVTFKGEGKKIPKLINKLLDNLFMNEPAAKERFLHWLAYIVQTHRKTNVAWGFFGASGTGKGIISEIVMRLVGARNAKMNVSDAALQSDFNEYMNESMFIQLNEVASDFHGRHGVAGKIKAMVTDDYITVNRKGVKEFTIKNYANIILNSNKPNPIELDPDDRRWNMIIVNKPLKDYKWFEIGVTGDKMLEKSDEFGAYLMNMEVDAAKATKVMPASKAKESVSEQTTSPLVKVGDVIKNGTLEDMLDMFGLDDYDLQFDIKELKEAFNTGFWTNSLLTDVYCYTMNKKHEAINNMTVTKYFVKPFVTLNKSEVVGNTRGYFVN